MDLLSILKNLISIDTSIEKSTLEAVYFVKQIFDERQLVSKIISYKNDRDRACLIASTGCLASPGLVLSGHLDTYGVSTQIKNWKTNPFNLYVANGTAIGRGVVDMKGAISSALYAIDRLKKINIPVHFILTHDEEGGFKGIKQLVDNNFYGLISPHQYGCIVMEPTQLNAILYHQGYERRKLIFKNLNYKNDGYEKCNLFKDKIIDIFRHTSFNVSEHFLQREFNLNIGDIELTDSKEAILEYQIKYSPENVSLADKFIKQINVESNKYSYYNSPLIIENIFKNKVLPFENNTNETFCRTFASLIKLHNDNIMDFGTEAGFFSNLE